jgi:hypothetical protein
MIMSVTFLLYSCFSDIYITDEGKYFNEIKTTMLKLDRIIDIGTKTYWKTDMMMLIRRVVGGKAIDYTID